MQTNNEYGRALFMLCEEEGCADSVYGELSDIVRILEESPKYIKLLDTPALPKEEKLRLIDEAFAPIDERVRNLIKILCEKHAVYSFFDAKKTYDSCYLESRKIEIVDAITAVKMTDSQIENLKIKLGEICGKSIIVNNIINPDILGGMVLRYDGKQLDGSVKARLDRLSAGLKNTVI